MTITIHVPQTAESGLQAEAQRVGLPVEQVVEKVLVNHFDLAGKESTREFFNRIGRPGPVIDTSRENIYADI